LSTTRNDDNQRTSDIRVMIVEIHSGQPSPLSTAWGRARVYRIPQTSMADFHHRAREGPARRIIGLIASEEVEASIRVGFEPEASPVTLG
jgi:hypothetical protein